MMLADINTITGIGGLVIGVGALVVAIVVAAKKQDVKITPSPLEVKEAANFVHRAEFEKHVEVNSQTHRDLFSKIGGVERGANTSTEAKIETVRKDLVSVGNQVAALQSETKLQNQQLSRMDAKLDRLTEKS